MLYRSGLLILCLFSIISAEVAWAQMDNTHMMTVARLKYSGGGDWYSNPTSLPNLLEELNNRIHLQTPVEEAVVPPSDKNLFLYPILYMNGHGTVRFSPQDVENLREYFDRGGFLWADDNYGMDESFRKEIRRVLPDSTLVELPDDHPVYSMYYQFENGLPKVHEHAGGPPHLYGMYHKGRLAVIYTFNTDIGDGLEDEGVHPDDSPQIREKAMQMAINLVLYALSN